MNKNTRHFQHLHDVAKQIVDDPHSADADAAAALRAATMKLATQYDDPTQALKQLYAGSSELSSLLRQAVAIVGKYDDDDGEEIEKARSAHGGLHGLGAAVTEHMLDRLSSLRRQHGFSKTAKDHNMDNLTKIAADIGIVGVAKAIVDKQRSYGISESAFVGLVTEHAKAAHPNLTGPQAFAKLYESEPSIWQACAVLKAMPLVADLTPLQVGGEDTWDQSDQSEAVKQLKQIGAQRYPSASPSTQFENALVDPANHKLARVAVPIPRATTSYPFPR